MTQVQRYISLLAEMTVILLFCAGVFRSVTKMVTSLNQNIKATNDLTTKMEDVANRLEAMERKAHRKW